MNFAVRGVDERVQHSLTSRLMQAFFAIFAWLFW